MKSRKILISGYYGFDNFGDDAILHMLVNNIKANIDKAQITVISNNPDKIKQNYGVDSIYRFDFKSIFSAMRKTSLFISGGGSLLQDVTSLNSLMYYLGLISLAEIFRKKVYIFAQGIGPITTSFGKNLASFLLKRADLVTVRDTGSQEFLKEIGVKSQKTADPVWGIEKKSNTEKLLNTSKINVGIQLRDWRSLDHLKLEFIAKAVNANFSKEIYKVNIISLQDSKDKAVSEKLLSILKDINSTLDVELISGLNINTALDVLSQLDYLVAMRLHANLVSIKYNVPTLAVSYDPKVEILAKDAGIPCVDIENITVEDLDWNIKQLVSNKDQYVSKMIEFSSKKEEESRQNIDLLIKMINK